MVLTTLGRISPKKADVEGETAGAALAPEPSWVLLMGDSGCGAGSAQGSCGFVKKWNCTGGLRVEEFKINPHLHPRPFNVDLGSMQVCVSSALLTQITSYGHFCSFHCGLIHMCA